MNDCNHFWSANHGTQECLYCKATRQEPIGSARADAIIKDILDNHLPRVIEGLKVGYVDENQILVIYDHAVRARILKEVEQNENQKEPT